MAMAASWWMVMWWRVTTERHNDRRSVWRAREVFVRAQFRRHPCRRATPLAGTLRPAEAGGCAGGCQAVGGVAVQISAGRPAVGVWRRVGRPGLLSVWRG